jgi:hypothetical protein
MIVGSDAAPKIQGLADIQYSSASIAKEIDAGLFREFC